MSWNLRAQELRSVDMMKFASLVYLAFILAACQAPEKNIAPAPVANSIAMRPKVDVRTIRVTLYGKKMREVVKTLGQPTTVYTIDDREVWEYDDIARDSITGRSVHLLEVVFKKRIVQNVNFSF